MRTSKSISCISYNTRPYLEDRLKELIDAKVIDAWCYIFHHKEADESKDHIHLWMNPTRMLQTADLPAHFQEPDLHHPDKKPLGIVFDVRHTISEWKDWYLYGLHDKAYLMQHGMQDRQYQYTPEDMVAHDPDWFDINKNMVVQMTVGMAATMISHAQRGGNFAELVAAGLISPNNYMNQKTMYADIQSTVRRTHPSHDPIEVDDESGEILDPEDNTNTDTDTDPHGSV